MGPGVGLSVGWVVRLSLGQRGAGHGAGRGSRRGTGHGSERGCGRGSGRGTRRLRRGAGGPPVSGVGLEGGGRRGGVVLVQATFRECSRAFLGVYDSFSVCRERRP